MKMKRSKSLSPEPSSSTDTKRVKLEETLEAKSDKATPCPHILEFSDDVLLNILKYVRPSDLLAISSCCQRLERITLDRTLWRRVDLREKTISLSKLDYYLRFLQPTTASLAIHGHINIVNPNNCSILSHSFIRTLKKRCNQLKELIIENYYIDGGKIQITDFPSTTEKLSLEGCRMDYFPSNKSYFFKIDLHMPNLTCLILSNCLWFTPHSLLVISKIPQLKELRLNSCHRLGECVAYASLATRFGFKTLEILDLRDTALGDSEVGCFSSTRTLTHLYLECPLELRHEQVSDVLQNHHFQHYQHASPELREFRIPIYEDRNVVQFLLEDGLPLESHGLQRCLISDRAICALGSDTYERTIINNSPQGVIILEEDKRIFNNPNLKSLVVRNYPRVTDSSLVHLALNASSLEYLDVSGTSVTKTGVDNFKLQKPNVTIVSSFDV